MLCIFSLFKVLNHHDDVISVPIIHQTRKINKILMAISLYIINWLMHPLQTTLVEEVEDYQEGALQGEEEVHEVVLHQVQDQQVREDGTCM